MTLHTDAGTAQPIHPIGTARVLRAFMRRDIDLVFIGILILLVGLAVAVAWESSRMSVDEMVIPLLGRLLRRFDMTMLFALSAMLAVRMASRIERDHAAGWMPPALAAGMSRRTCGLNVALASFIRAAAYFLVVASAFAIAVNAFAGTPELVRALPRTLTMGLIVLGMLSVCTAVIGIALRSAASTLFVIAAVILVPLLMLTRSRATGAPPPEWVLWISWLMPLPLTPELIDQVIRGGIYMAIGASLLLVVSHRFAGRQP